MHSASRSASSPPGASLCDVCDNVWSRACTHTSPRKYRTKASSSAKGQEVVMLISGVWKMYVSPDDLNRSLLTCLKVEIALLLRLHRKDIFCAPQDWKQSSGGRRSTVTMAVLPSFDLFFGNNSGTFSHDLVHGTNWPRSSGLWILRNVL